MYVLSHLPAVLDLIVRGGIFQLLGRLCELYPEVMTCHSEGLIKIMAGTLKLENGKKKPDMPVIGGCLKGLCSYLINFTQSVSEGEGEGGREGGEEGKEGGREGGVSHSNREV